MVSTVITIHEWRPHIFRLINTFACVIYTHARTNTATYFLNKLPSVILRQSIIHKCLKAIWWVRVGEVVLVQKDISVVGRRNALLIHTQKGKGKDKFSSVNGRELSVFNDFMVNCSCFFDVLPDSVVYS